VENGTLIRLRETRCFCIVNYYNYLNLEFLYFGSKPRSCTDVFVFSTDQDVQRLVFFEGGGGVIFISEFLLLCNRVITTEDKISVQPTVIFYVCTIPLSPQETPSLSAQSHYHHRRHHPCLHNPIITTGDTIPVHPTAQSSHRFKYWSLWQTLANIWMSRVLFTALQNVLS
jgi:hypothetical protein